jgi:lipid-binding SYLF domain-containing protein
MSKVIVLVSVIAFGSMVSCATAPDTVDERQTLESRARTTVQEMTAQDADLRDLIAGSYGYVVFPEIGKGGAVVGAAWGRGVMFEQGRPTGFVELNQGSIGAQLGGQTFAELIVLQDARAAERIRSGTFEIGGNVSAVVLKAGAAKSATFTDGVAVFQMPRGGMMVELSVAGQKLNYEPRD